MNVLTMNLQRRAPLFFVGGLIAASCGGAGPAQMVRQVAIADAAVQIIANGCSQVEIHGAGLMVAPGRIATVAHVVAGATQIEVNGASGAAPASVVYFDPVYDVAVLKVGLDVAEPIPIGTAAPGDHGTVIVYRADAPVEEPAEVQRLVDIRTADIYGEGKHLRPGYELTLDIQAGDSGAVVVVDHRAVALVWATSRLAEGRAWAMRTSLIADHLSAEAPVDNGRCA